MTDINSGPGWYEVINPRNATTCIVHVQEDGTLYLPEGEKTITQDEFAFAAARGNAYRLVRADEPEQLVHVGWWCWRGDGHGHLATMPCRSDNVPLHVPAEWEHDMREVLQKIEDGGEEPPHPPHHSWLVEMRLDDGEWHVAYPTHDHGKALDRLARRREENPDRQWRLVRETTSYTLEPEPTDGQ